MTTITHLYDTYAEAERVVSRLETEGVPHGDISLVGRQDTVPGTAAGDEPAAEGSGAGTGASLGTIIGGGAGLLAGIGAIAIPGVGPVVAAGWLIATVTGAGAGAAAGGLLGSLTQGGVPERDAHLYAEGVRRGGTLVSVRTTEANAVTVSAILDESGSVDLAGRRAEYEGAGWTAHDPAADPLDPAIDDERDSTRTL